MKQQQHDVSVWCRLLTLSSGESSAEVATESDDIAEGGLTWAERSEREVEVLERENMTNDDRKVSIFSLSTDTDISHAISLELKTKNTE